MDHPTRPLASSCDIALMATNDAPPAPVHIMTLAQNIGAIECDEKDEEVTAANKKMTADWVASMKGYIEAQADASGAPIDVVVLHLQEVGGKKFNKAFIAHLSAVVHGCFPAGGWCSGLILPDENDGVTFTAMASVLYVAPRLVPVASLLSFRHRVYIACSDGPLQWVGNRRALFHGAKFSNAGTSRKGFLLTSLRIGMKVFNFVNVHLFHDADNSVAVKASPSEYADRRVDAIVEALTEIEPVTRKEDPLFIFGDFNFRLDVHRVVKAMNQTYNCDIKFGKKKVEAPAELWAYFQDPGNWDDLRTYDTEGPRVTAAARDKCGVQLDEWKREFGPTYLIETEEPNLKKNATTADTTGPNARIFKRDRFPAWCDRVWFNTAAAGLFTEAMYWTPPLIRMDHLPVALVFKVPCPSL